MRMILLSGHTLNVKNYIFPEAMSLNLEERNSTATLTLGPEAPEIGINDWIKGCEDPGKGIVWRVKSVSEDVEKSTRTISLEHVIQYLKDRVIFGEVNAETVAGAGAKTCSALAMASYAMARQSEWKLGALGENPVQPYKFNGENIYAVLETLTNTMADMQWEYDLSKIPFVLNIRKIPTAVDSEMRMHRNITTMRRQIDRTRMYTRIYPIGKENLHIAGDYLSKNEKTWGVVCKVETNQTKETEAELRAWAQERLNRHCEPLVTVTISGLDLSRATGESLDKITIGRRCRVPLPDKGITITERVTRMSWSDAVKEPEKFTVTLANQLEDVATIMNQIQEAIASGTGGGGGRYGAAKAEEDHAWFVDTNDHVGMVAEAVAGPGASKDWSRVASVIVDGQGIHQRVSYTEEGVKKHEAEIEVQDHFIRQTVKAIGKDGEVTAASICLAISKAGSSATISADHIILSGKTKINDVMTVLGNAVGFRKPVICDANIDVSSKSAINCYTINLQGGNPVTLTSLEMLKAVKDFEIDGNTLKLTRWNGTTENFSRATAITQSWVSGSKSVMATASGAESKYFSVDFRFMSGPGVYFIELFGGVGGAANSLAGTSRNIQLGRNNNTVEIQDGNGNKIANTPTYIIPAASWSYGNMQESSSQPSGAAKSYSIDTRYAYHYFDVTVGGETKRIAIRS